MTQKLILSALFAFCCFAGFAQAWKPKSSLPVDAQPRHHPVTFSIAGKGYLLTGGAGNSYLNDFYSYDPVTDTWEKLDDFPGESRSYAYGTSANGKGYIGFGQAQNGALLKDLWEFNPEDGSWKELAECPCAARTHPVFIDAGKKIFVGAGGSATGNRSDFWEYDIVKDEWTEKPELPAQPRHHPYYFSIGDSLVFAGLGHGSVNIQGKFIYRDFFKYNVFKEEWEALQWFPGEGRVAGTQFSYNGKGYVLHGDGDEHIALEEGEFWEYDPKTDEWTQLESMDGRGRWAPGSFLIDNIVYLTCGGATINGVYVEVKDMWAYELPKAPNVGINFVKNDLNIEAYPNPASDDLKFRLPDEIASSDFSVRLFAANGKSIPVPGDLQSGLRLSGLPAGLYYLQIQGLNSVSSVKLIKRD